MRYHQKKHENSPQVRIVEEIFDPDNLMPKITSVAGNVTKIVDDSIIGKSNYQFKISPPGCA